MELIRIVLKLYIIKICFETPLQVNNCVESFLGPGYYDKNYGHALVTANLLRNEF